MEFDVELTDEHLERSSKAKSIDALKEIIWNSIDADANEITISLLKGNSIDNIDNEMPSEIVVFDDGHGLNFDGYENALKSLGKSEKTYSYQSPSGRHYHGKLGEGRYTYFSIGENINWTSVYRDTSSNNLSQFEVNFNSDYPKKVNIVESKPSSENHTGMKVAITNLKDRPIHELMNNKNIIENLTKEFAPYLLAYKSIKIEYDGKQIDADKHIKFSDKYSIRIGENDFNLLIVKWNDIKSSEIFYSGDDNVIYKHEPFEDVASSCTFYLQSSYFDKAKLDGTIDDFDMSQINYEISKFIKKSYKAFLSKNKRTINKDYIEDLRNSGIYPYESNPSSSTEEAQQKLFDIVAIELNEVVPNLNKSSKSIKKLTYHFVNEALKTDPSNFKKILEGLFDLSEEQRADFAKLLDDISMSAILYTMNEVLDRLSFLDELNRIVYTDEGQYVKERTQFQKLLLSQLWIFGDKYKYGTDDVNLRNVLKAYMKELELDKIELTEDDYKNSDFNKIPDLVLWSNQKLDEHYENLVVEIKRPTKVIGRNELQQIKDYAFSIVNDGRFSAKDYKWRFILIGKEISPFVKNEMKSTQFGYFKNDNYRLEVMTWSELICTNKLRYDYFKKKANIDFTDKRITDSIATRWKDLLGDKSPISNQRSK